MLNLRPPTTLLKRDYKFIMNDIDFGSLSDYSKQIRDIKKAAKRLRNLRPKVNSSWQEPADWVVKDSNMHGKPAVTLTITLMPTGCEWAKSGGCTMCGEFEGSTKGETVPGDFHVAQFASAISKYAVKYKPAWLRIYQEGNYMNEKEIENSAQSIILRLSSMLKGIERITIESMAKYITQARAAHLKSIIDSDVEIEVGMGFEAQNDIVRNVCVNKGESLRVFRNAVKSLKRSGIRSVAYVLLKPPFLSESEAIKEAIATIKIANEIGFDAISLEPVSIHAFTLVHALNIVGCYEVPWLWSIIEVAKHVRDVSDFRIGGVGFYPRPIGLAENKDCNRKKDCDEETWNAIREYGRYRDLNIFNALECDCKNKWEKVCAESIETPLKQRIDQQLNQLNFSKYSDIINGDRLKRQPVAGHTTAVAGGTQYKE